MQKMHNGVLMCNILCLCKQHTECRTPQLPALLLIPVGHDHVIMRNVALKKYQNSAPYLCSLCIHTLSLVESHKEQQFQLYNFYVGSANPSYGRLAHPDSEPFK